MKINKCVFLLFIIVGIFLNGEAVWLLLMGMGVNFNYALRVSLRKEIENALYVQ